MSLFNELLISLYLYSLLSLSGYLPNPYREQTGWALLGVLALSIGVNFGKFLIVSVHALWRHRLEIRDKLTQVFIKVISTC
jgi:hypothetical protein